MDLGERDEKALRPAEAESLDGVVAWLFRVEPRPEVRKYVVARALSGSTFELPGDLASGIVSTYRSLRLSGACRLAYLPFAAASPPSPPTASTTTERTEMNSYEQQYLDLLQRIMTDGVRKRDRTGTGTTSLFGAQLRFDVGREFPLLTTKKLYTKAILVELEWMLRGRTDVAYLQERNCTIWDEWADKNGDLGPVYGKQWRSWDYCRQTRESALGDSESWISTPGTDRVTAFGKIDQIANALDLIKRDPFSRRNVVTAWNPAQNDEMALHPCHCLFQFNCRPITSIAERKMLLGVDHVASDLHIGGKIPDDAPNDDSAAHAVLDVDGAPRFYLDVHLYQRSADVFLGVPFNIASYAMLLMIMARCAGPQYAVGDLVHTFGDVHVYTNHEDQVREQISRIPKLAPIVELSLPSGSAPWDFTYDMVAVRGYDPHPAIKAEVSV